MKLAITEKRLFDASHDIREHGDPLEIAIINLWNANKPDHELVHIAGRAGDAYFKKGCDRVEIKNDFYNNSNFFIERISVKATGAKGGPWQAMEGNNEYFMNVKLWQRKAYLYKTKDLCEYDFSNYDLLPVVNKGFTTQGYKIAIQNLENHCFMIVDFIKGNQSDFDEVERQIIKKMKKK